MVKFLDLKAQYHSIKNEIDQALLDVLESTEFTLGRYVKEFEDHFAKAHNAKWCVGVNNGTSALHIVLMALNIGHDDEVIVPANTFFATAEAVSLTGAIPVFVDCENNGYALDPQKTEAAITPKTKAIIPVHLYGHAAPLSEIKQITDRHHLYLIEDCAQAHLCKYKGSMVGTFGVAGCFSFYPGKNLGAYGEAGAVLTNDDNMYNKMRMFRDHGSPKKYHHDVIGHNYRMEGFQGAILDVKLRYLADWTEKRRRHAPAYCEMLNDVGDIALPVEKDYAYHVYHLFVIRTKQRDKLAAFLQQNEIGTGIHYPIPCHLQKAYAFLKYKQHSLPNAEQYANEVLSLPMYAELTDNEISTVCDAIRQFFTG